MIKKHILLYLIISFIFCGCFARGGDLDGSSTVNSKITIMEGKANLSGRISSDSSAIFSFVTPFVTPVKDALVEIEETGNRTNTDSTGAFEFINIDPGIYTIKSYRHISDNTFYMGKMTVSVKIGENVLPSEIYLDKPGGIRGYLSVGLSDLSDLSVIIGPDGNVYNFSADNSFLADRLSEGTYSVLMHRRGYKPIDMGEYKVNAGSITQISSIPLPYIPENITARTLSVFLMDGNNTLLSGGKIIIENAGLWSWSDITGKAVFTGITYETVDLSVKLQGYGQYEESFAVNSVENEKIIILNRTRTYTDPKLTLTVRDESGNVINGALLRPYPELDVSYTDLNGIGVVNTNTGTTQVSIEKTGYVTDSITVNIQPGVNLTGEIILKSDTITQNYTYSGTVYNETTGVNQGGAIIRDEQTGLSVLTDNNGNFSLLLPTGYHLITVEYMSIFKGNDEITLNGNLSGQIINISN